MGVIITILKIISIIISIVIVAAIATQSIAPLHRLGSEFSTRSVDILFHQFQFESIHFIRISISSISSSISISISITILGTISHRVRVSFLFLWW